MPDISKCLSEACPLKDNCYRYTSKPSEYRQAYADFKYDEENGCDSYWPNKDRKETNERNRRNRK